MKPVAAPCPNPGSMLAGAQYGDAFALRVAGQALDAETAARRALGRTPGWIGRLMSLRNALVGPLGLRTPRAERRAGHDAIGAFPLIGRSPRRVVLGFDDKHLDFRVLVDVADLGDGEQSVTATTVVRTHNAFGRIYLAIVKPFHRIIVPAMLAQAARE